MKLIKWSLFAIIISFSNNSLAQDEDYFVVMGASKASILKINSQNKRIVNGEYYELSFSMSSDTNFNYYFDENLLCNKVIIQKDLKYYENAKLILSGDFPRKGEGGETLFYWNSRMMASLLKLEDSFIVVYEKVNPKFLKK